MIFTLRARHDTIAVMQAVLFDMDGTLVDSEKLWDISLAALYTELGGELSRRSGRRWSAALRKTPSGPSTPTWAWTLDPVAMAEVRPLAA